MQNFEDYAMSEDDEEASEEPTAESTGQAQDGWFYEGPNTRWKYVQTPEGTMRYMESKEPKWVTDIYGNGQWVEGQWGNGKLSAVKTTGGGGMTAYQGAQLARQDAALQWEKEKSRIQQAFDERELTFEQAKAKADEAWQRIQTGLKAMDTATSMFPYAVPAGSQQSFYRGLNALSKVSGNPVDYGGPAAMPFPINPFQLPEMSNMPPPAFGG